MVRVGIVGAAGLSGQELLYWLSTHSEADVVVATTEKYQGIRIEDAFPFLMGQKLFFQGHEADFSVCDVVFLAIPNQASLDYVPRLVSKGNRVIDMSGVYRLKNTSVFEKYYGLKHTSPELLTEAVFGLPEYYRKELKDAKIVANPGCYPTGALLGILPFGKLLKDLSRPPIIDAKSGVSGAGGRVEDDATNFVEVNENFKAYKAFNHQHQPEINQYLNELGPFDSSKLGETIFTPYLLPLNRGILTGIYMHFNRKVSDSEVRKIFDEFAEQNPFIRIMPEGSLPDIQSVVRSNRCLIGWASDESGCNWLVQTSIDNLVKGASGQAIQNMNIMFGIPETYGLA